MLRPSSCQHLSCLMTGAKRKDASRGGTRSRRVSANESTQMTTVTFKPDSPRGSDRSSWVLIIVEVVVTLMRPVHALQSPKTVLRPNVLFRTLAPGVTWLWASLWRDNIYGGVKHEQEIPKMSKELDEQSASAPTLKIHAKWLRKLKMLKAEI